MTKFKLELASVVEINDAINGFTGNNRLDFDLQWDFEEFMSAIKESAERYVEEQQKVIKEIGEEVDGGYKYNPMVLAQRMEKTGKKEISFQAKPILMADITAEITRKKAASQAVEISGIEMRVLRKHGVIVDKIEEEKKPKE